MSTLVGGTGIIGQDIFCSFGNGKYTTFEGTEIVAENCVKARVKDLVVEGKTCISDVPCDDYTILDYIECTGTQYIDTEFKANTTTTKFIGAFTPTKQVMGALLGSRNGTASGPHACNVFVLGEGKFRVDWANASYSGTEINYEVGTKCEMEITRGRLVINNTTKSYTNSASVDQLGNFLIGTFNNVSTPYADGFVGYIHECKLYSNDVLIRDFIPVKRNLDNKVGMYDTVTKTFYANAGTGSFIAGENAIPSSSNEIEIKSVAEREENLVNTATIYESMLESGTVDSLFNPKSSSTYDMYKMEIQPNTEYLFNLVGYGQSPWVRILDKNNIIVKSQSLSSTGLSYIWSLKTEDNFYYLVFNKPKTSTGEFKVYKKENPYPLKLKINEENNYINLPIPLRSLPNGVADTIEGDKLVQRVGKVVIDGTQTMILSNVSQTKTTRGYFTIENAKISKGNNNLICNWYIREGQHGDYEYIIIQKIVEETLNTVFISVLNSKLETTDVNGLKKYFKENPLPVYYELAEPIIHDLTVPQLSTAKGTNIITTSNNIKPKISMKVKVK